MQTNTAIMVNAHKKRLITLINIAKGQLGLDDEVYRPILKAATGKDSLRAMNVGELEQALEAFKQKGFKPVANKQHSGASKTGVKRRLSPKAGSAKVAQIDKIRAIWITMGHHLVIRDSSESALDTYVRRMTHKASIQDWGAGVDTAAWLTEQQAERVLESLKNWHKRVLVERIIARGERLEMNDKNTRPAGYDVIVAQYEGCSREAASCEESR